MSRRHPAGVARLARRTIEAEAFLDLVDHDCRHDAAPRLLRRLQREAFSSDWSAEHKLGWLFAQELGALKERDALDLVAIIRTSGPDALDAASTSKAS
jgi:hypothetical protein